MKYAHHTPKADRYRQEIAEHESRARQYRDWASKVTGTDRRAQEVRADYLRRAEIADADAAKERRNLARELGQPVQSGFAVTETGQITLFGEAA
jgi:hypothetical protein